MGLQCLHVGDKHTPTAPICGSLNAGLGEAHTHTCRAPSHSRVIARGVQRYRQSGGGVNAPLKPRGSLPYLGLDNKEKTSLSFKAQCNGRESSDGKVDFKKTVIIYNHFLGESRLLCQGSTEKAPEMS